MAMELADEIKTAARRLGQSLRQDDAVHPYYQAIADIQADPEASSLEKKMYELYEAIIARQQADEEVSEDDASLYRELREEVQAHPLIAKRREALRVVKPYLAEIADEISLPLGVDYPALAKPQ